MSGKSVTAVFLGLCALVGCDQAIVPEAAGLFGLIGTQGGNCHGRSACSCHWL